MICRELPICEWERVKPLLNREFPTEPLPRPGVRIFVLEDEGRIVGFTTTQPILHMEPTWIAPLYRGRLNLIRQLTELVERSHPDMLICLAMTTNERVGALLEIFGMEHMKEWRVYRWLRKRVANGKPIW